MPQTAGVKRFLNSFSSGGTRDLYSPGTLDATILRRDGGVLLDFSGEHFADKDAIGNVFCYPYGGLYGWWAPTLQVFDLTIYDYSQPALTPTEAASERIQLADYLESPQGMDMPEYAQWIRSGKQSMWRTIPSGYVRDGISIVCFVLLCSQLVMWFCNAYRKTRTRRALAKGDCPVCGYQLRETLSCGCPECGWRRVEGGES
ncbi:MAG TPA: hypothetical protein VG711_12330 [Phycisphaerales bacterium]|nr:hypothetical protein [Phycisphaerales bacterium]